jgi:hypothetical protein
MTLPANIRVNIGAPFPATVKGSGPVAISKQNGIWTVGFQIANLGIIPPGTDPTTLVALVWNSVTATFQQATVSSLVAAAVKPTPISAANSPYSVQPSDTFLYVDTSFGPVEIDMPAAASRNGSMLSIKDVTGHGAANNITVKPVGGGAPETIDGYTNAAPLVIDANYGGVKLSPGTLKYVIAP